MNKFEFDKSIGFLPGQILVYDPSEEFEYIPPDPIRHKKCCHWNDDGELRVNHYGSEVPLCPMCLDDKLVQYLVTRYLKEDQTAHRCNACQYDWIVMNATEEVLRKLRAEVDGFKL